GFARFYTGRGLDRQALDRQALRQTRPWADPVAIAVPWGHSKARRGRNPGRNSDMNDTAGSAGLTPAPSAAPDAAAASAARKAKLRPLRLLVPYVLRYRGRAAAALVALLTAAITTLVVPIAVRRMIDFGFEGEHVGLIDQYFGVMIAVVAVLAVASASRYYLVTTLGERVVADLRSAVFGHLIALSAPFFDTARTGELTSRLTADTTQIKSAVGSSVSVALRNVVLFL